MNNIRVIVLASALLAMLVGCGGNNAGFGPAPDTGVNGVEAVFATDPDGDPADISDATALGISIDGVFGTENTEPHSVGPLDTIGDVLNRARNA